MNISNLIKQFSKNELIMGSFFVFIGTTISSFLAFILNLFLARTLSYSDYGIYASLLSLFALAIIPAQSLGTVITNFATRFIHSNEIDKASALYKTFFKYIIVFIFLFSLFSFFISQPISHFLRISDFWLVFFLLFVVSVNYLITLNTSFLNSLLKFKFLSFVYSVGGITRLVVGVFLVYLGFEVYGAIGAIFAIIVIQFLLTLPALKTFILSKPSKSSVPILEIVKYSLPASISIFFLFSFVSSDVILVKHFFNPVEAGLYGGLSLVGKVIFYFTLPIPAVMFPLLVKKHTNSESYDKLFILALIIVIIPSILITIFYYLMPQFTINIFLGQGYSEISKYLALFGVFLTIYSINNVFMMFYLSIKKYLPSLFIAVFALLQLILIFIYHEDFYQIIYISIITSVLLLICFLLYYLLISKSYLKNKS